jgi:hypothetical protein
MKITDSLLTIVWVSIPVRPKLPLRVRRLLQKVIILNATTFGLWPQSEGSRGRTLGFLQFDWWKSTTSWPSVIVWSVPKSRPLHARDWSPWLLHFKHSHWWKRRSRSKFASHYAWGTNGVCECQVGCKVYMGSYMSSNGSCFMVTWISFKNDLLDAGITQNRRPWHSERSPPLFYYVLSCVRTCMKRNPKKWHLV